jgi:hypothetical protein
MANPPTFASLSTLFLASTLAFAVGCSGSGDASPRALAFHGSANPIPSFTYDTGWIPSSGPLAVDLAAQASGATTVDAGATLHGAALEPAKGSGKLALSLSFGISGKLQVNQDGLVYMGPIPGLANVMITFAGTQAFDPFLIGGSATVTASPTTTMLPPIDLTAVGLPGATLNLTLDAASQITSTFQGTCTGVRGGQAEYLGQLSTAGTLKLHASLAFSVLGVSKSIDLPTEIAVPIPATAQTIAMSPEGSGAGGSSSASCAASADDGDAGPGSEGGFVAAVHDGGAGGDAATSEASTATSSEPPSQSSGNDAAPPTDAAPACYASAAFTPWPWAPPTPFGQDACTAPQLASYIACLSSPTGDCSAFHADATNATCLVCLETDINAATHGPMLTMDGPIVSVNWGGCQAHYDGQTGAHECGEQTNDDNDCVIGECETCADFGNPAPGGPSEQCIASAQSGTCSPYAVTAGCEAETNDGGVAAACNDIGELLAQWCGGG